MFWTLQFNLTFNTGAAFSRFPGLGPYIGILAAVVAVGVREDEVADAVLRDAVDPQSRT